MASETARLAALVASVDVYAHAHFSDTAYAWHRIRFV